MAKKINSRPLGVTTLYAPPSIKVKPRVVGGALTQWYNESNGTYTPDRKATPLMIPIDIIAAVTETRELLTPTIQNITWREVLPDGTSTIVAKIDNGQITDTTDYAITQDGQLVVMKNVLPEQPITLRWYVRWTDPRNGQSYTNEGQETMTTSRASDPTYKVIIEEPTKRWNPLADTNVKGSSGRYEVPITAKAMQGDTDVTQRVKFFWYYSEGDTLRLVDDNEHPSLAYISGQGTPTLIVDPDYESDRQSYVCKIGIPASGQSKESVTAPVDYTSATATVSWLIPRTDGFVFSPNGRSARESIDKMEFVPKFRQGRNDVSDEIINERTVQDWTVKRDNSAAVTYLGAMPTVTLRREQLAATDGSRAVVNAETTLLSPYEAVVDDVTGAVVVDDVTGDIVVCRSMD